VRKRFPALAALADIIGDRQVRQHGHDRRLARQQRPAADYPAPCSAWAHDRHQQAQIEADKFSGLYETALEPGS